MLKRPLSLLEMEGEPKKGNKAGFFIFASGKTLSDLLWRPIKQEVKDIQVSLTKWHGKQCGCWNSTSCFHLCSYLTPSRGCFGFTLTCWIPPLCRGSSSNTSSANEEDRRCYLLLPGETRCVIEETSCFIATLVWSFGVIDLLGWSSLECREATRIRSIKGSSLCGP